MSIFSHSEKVRESNLKRSTKISRQCMLSEKPLVKISLDVPFCKPAGRKNISSIELADVGNYEFDSSVFQPFPQLNLVSMDWLLRLPIRMGSGSNLSFYIDINVLYINEEFGDMLRADKFEAALDREMYNCWGAGGYRFNYESGIDWQYRQLNNTDWLHYKTKLKRSPERRKNYVFLNETFSTAITERRILEIKIRLSANCDKDKYYEFVAWIENAQQLIINSISLDMDPAWYKNNRQIKAKYSDIKRTQARDKVVWTEKINDLFDIRRQPGMPLYDVSDDYSGKTELEEILVINFDEIYDSTFVLNVPQANKTAHPAIKKLLEQQKTLADKIHKTLESHYGNNPLE